MLEILLAISLTSFGVMCVGAFLAMSVLSKWLNRLVSFSIGALLTTSFLHLLPESIEKFQGDVHLIFYTLLAGIFLFFLLERFSLLRHSHHHEGDGHSHHHGFDHHHAGKGGWSMVLGTAIHGFSDGVLIVSAFLIDHQLGWLTTLSIAAHELPNRLGAFVVLLSSGMSRRAAFWKSLISCMGGWLGLLLMLLIREQVQSILPFLTVLAASSFIYIAMADLIPQVQQKGSIRIFFIDMLMIFLGSAGVMLIASLVHIH
jgi:zinc and cadmium transporter